VDTSNQTLSSESLLIETRYNAGDFIFFEGDLDSNFYIVKSGKVNILTKNTKGERIKVAQIDEGESFGEFAFLDKTPRTATAQAETAVTLILVSELAFQKLLDDLPIWASSMLKSFAHRITLMNERIKKQI